MNELSLRPMTSESAYVFQASFAQQRLWLVDRLLPEGSVYNIGHALRLVGDLDVAALRWAPDDVVRQPELTADTFLGNALSRDRQIRVRGSRIALGEIGAILARCDGTANAIATIRRDGAGRELPGVTRVGVHDDFLDLGGYSLLALQLLHWQQARHGDAPAMREFFSDPAVAGLEGCVQRALDARGRGVSAAHGRCRRQSVPAT